jgi:hypothetical protein
MKACGVLSVCIFVICKVNCSEYLGGASVDNLTTTQSDNLNHAGIVESDEEADHHALIKIINGEIAAEKTLSDQPKKNNNN